MINQRVIDVIVGLFIIVSIIALSALAFRVSGLTAYTGANTYRVQAEFTNIGDLKVRAPVTVAGVTIGRVVDIDLDENNYRALVTMQLDKKSRVPIDSTASILTAGLIGANYIEIVPGFEETFLKNGGKIVNTNQALILQNLIGQLLFNAKGDKGKVSKKLGK